MTSYNFYELLRIVSQAVPDTITRDTSKQH